MTKIGMFRIGFIKNMREYPQVIKSKAGISYVDFNFLNTFIDAQWDDRFNTTLCYDEAGNEVDATSANIKFFLVNTGYTESISGDTLYARFDRNSPAELDTMGWQGVEIETKMEFQNSFLDTTCTHNLFSSYSYGANYAKVSRILTELTQGDVFSEEDCRNLVQASFVAAMDNQELAVVSNHYNSDKQISFFPLADIRSAVGDKLFLKMERNWFSDTVKWYGAFVVTESELKDELLDYFVFHTGYFSFDTNAKVNAFYDGLAEKAMKENWKWTDATQNATYSQPILKSYLEYTYYRLLDEDAEAERKNIPLKIITENGKRYFNSGLLDRNFRQIIIVGDVLDLQQEIPGMGTCTWKMMRNIHAYSHNAPEIARMFKENELPGIATYFEDYRQVVFDARLDIHTNDNHIFEDGVARGRLPKYQDEYNRVKDNEVEKDLLLARIARDFDSARDRAKLMAERNYKLAVPQFWKETGEIQFLLPIYLGEREEAEKPQCALVLSLDKTGRRWYYRGETILTLDMAYNNTRLIAKPDVFWLNDLV
ncbi:MAG: DUF3825 domain-containing protein [Oscillospiraceae bacterium]|nr:DUF3825 domain-containing protein [Oscillospiraceae bacterium]MBQ9148244.1 DUF3825 domain-containing protein [Oscillospiraceae bacterium]